MASTTSTIAVQCLLVLSALLPVMATFPPTQELRDEGYETVHEYRRRLGIDYKFTPQWVSPEMCRTISEEQCQELDESFERGVRSNRKLLEHHKQRRAQGTPSSLRVLVLLVQWENHADKPLIPPDEIEQVFNSDNVGDDIVPTGSISRYFQVNSYGQFDITADIVPWMMTDDTEEVYASFGDSGRSPELANAWTPILEALDSSGFDFSPYDQDGDRVLDLTVTLHSGYAAELGGTDCNTGATREQRIGSHASSSMGGDWRSVDGYRLGPYSVASAYRQRCNANVARLGVITHEIVHPFGIPDLYDFDGSLNPTGNVGGMGRYDIMVGVAEETLLRLLLCTALTISLFFVF
jgi:M6 family metalloprotease-like protein